MTWREIFNKTLKETLTARQERNPQYSLRAFARDLDFSPGGLSSIMTNRLSLSEERAKEMIARLDLPPRAHNFILSLMRAPFVRDFVKVEADDKAEWLTNWTYLSIPHFYTLDNFEPTFANIARRLNITEAEVEKAVEYLLDKKILKRTSDGTIVKEEIYTASGDGPSSEMIRAHHRESLKLAARAIDEIPHTRRQFSTLTFSGDEKKIEEARKAILEFHTRLSALMEGECSRDQVYRMSVALFPIDFEKVSQ